MIAKSPYDYCKIVASNINIREVNTKVYNNGTKEKTSSKVLKRIKKSLNDIYSLVNLEMPSDL